jgi:hypothetical protein
MNPTDSGLRIRNEYARLSCRSFGVEPPEVTFYVARGSIARPPRPRH